MDMTLMKIGGIIMKESSNNIISLMNFIEYGFKEESDNNIRNRNVQR